MAFTVNIKQSDIYPPLPTIAELAEKETKRVNFIVTATILGGFDYEVNGTTYHFSYQSSDQANWMQEAYRADEAVANGQKDTYRAYWQGHKADGGVDTLVFTYDEFKTILMYSGTWKSDILASGWNMKAQLRACTTEAELKAKVKELDIDAKERAARKTYATISAESDFGIAI